jgi:hypothetical protein
MFVKDQWTEDRCIILDILVSSISLNICFYGSTTLVWLLYFHNIFSSQEVYGTPSFVLANNCFSYLGHFVFPFECLDFFSVSVKNILEMLIVITLNLKISLSNIDI